MEWLPADLPVWGAVVLIVASFVTSAVTASFGVGGGVALLALLTYFLPVTALIPVHGTVQLGSNVGRAFVQRDFIVWRAALPFVAGTFAGAVLAALLFVQLSEMVLQIVLGIFIAISAWISFPALRNATGYLFAAGGTLTGFLTMFVGATGPLAAVFFSKTFADRRNFIGTHAFAMAMQHGTKITAFVLAGFQFADWLMLIAAMVATGYVGTVAGSRLLGVINENQFRRIFPWILTLVAADIIRRAWL